MPQSSQEVLEFWFNQLTPAQWFKQSQTVDQMIAERFATTLDAAAKGELWRWRDHAHGRLAEIIVLDQFSRNIFRHQPRAFAQDAMALVLAQEAVRVEADQELSLSERAFLYMPYMHSESKLIHHQAVVLYQQPGLETNFEFELRHQEIIERFGRYPHRNKVLGRPSTQAELEFLQQPNSSF